MNLSQQFQRTKLLSNSMLKKNPDVEHLEWLDTSKKEIVSGGFGKDCCGKCSDFRFIDLFFLRFRDSTDSTDILQEFSRYCGPELDFPTADDLLAFIDSKDNPHRKRLRESRANYGPPNVNLSRRILSRIFLFEWAFMDLEQIRENLQGWYNKAEQLVINCGFEDECCNLCRGRRITDLFILKHREDVALMQSFFAFSDGVSEDYKLKQFCSLVDNQNSIKKEEIERMVTDSVTSTYLDHVEPYLNNNIDPRQNVCTELSLSQTSSGRGSMTSDDYKTSTPVKIKTETTEIPEKRKSGQSEAVGTKVVYRDAPGVVFSWSVNDSYQFRKLLLKHPPEGLTKYQRLERIMQDLKVPEGRIPKKNLLNRMANSDGKMKNGWTYEEETALLRLMKEIPSEEYEIKYERAKLIANRMAEKGFPNRTGGSIYSKISNLNNGGIDESEYLQFVDNETEDLNNNTEVLTEVGDKRPKSQPNGQEKKSKKAKIDGLDNKAAGVAVIYEDFPGVRFNWTINDGYQFKKLMKKYPNGSKYQRTNLLMKALKMPDTPIPKANVVHRMGACENSIKNIDVGGKFWHFEEERALLLLMKQFPQTNFENKMERAFTIKSKMDELGHTKRSPEKIYNRIKQMNEGALSESEFLKYVD